MAGPGHNAPSRLSTRTTQLLLAALLLFFLTWDLRAVLLDERPGTGFTDTTTVDVLELRQSINSGGLPGAHLRSAKGPLAAALGAGVHLLVGDLAVATRLVSVACHLVVLLLVFGLARRLSARPAVGLLAVVICGTFPLEFGWFRMDFHEPLVAVAVLACMRAMMGELRRPASAAALGLGLGLGLLTKLTFPLFVIFPALWFIGVRVRSRRAAGHLLLAGVVAAAVAGWWVIAYRDAIVTNASDSSGLTVSWLSKLTLALGIPGLLWILAGATAGAALAWWRSPPHRDRLVILVLCPVGAFVLLLGLFDWWSRYMVPALPVAGLLVALGLHHLVVLARQRRPGVPARLAGAALAAALLGLYVHANLWGVPTCWLPEPGRSPGPPGEAVQRELFLGMIAPDRARYTGFASAAALLRRNRWTALEAPPREPATFTEARRRAGLLTVDRAAAGRLMDAGGEVFLLMFHHDPDPLVHVPRASSPGGSPARPLECPAGMKPAECAPMRAYYRWLGAHDLAVVRTFQDPDAVMYSVIRVRR